MRKLWEIAGNVLLFAGLVGGPLAAMWAPGTWWKWLVTGVVVAMAGVLVTSVKLPPRPVH